MGKKRCGGENPWKGCHPLPPKNALIAASKSHAPTHRDRQYSPKSPDCAWEVLLSSCGSQLTIIPFHRPYPVRVGITSGEPVTHPQSAPSTTRCLAALGYSTFRCWLPPAARRRRA